MKLNLRVSLSLVIALGLVGISIIASKGHCHDGSSWPY